MKVKEHYIYEFGVRVLISEEDGEICAHALELDLLGYGKNEEAAIEDMLSTIECQISFARTKNDDSLLPFPAPKEFFQEWEVAHSAALRNEIARKKSKALAIKAVWVAFRGKKSMTVPKGRFKAMALSCA